MDELADPNVREVDPATVLPIVVGASIEAEVTDRRLAYRLRDVLAAGAGGDGADPGEAEEARGGPVPVVCTDLWYLNSAALRVRPTIAIGPPEVNAATAYLGSRVPTALLVEEQYRIQLDPELIDLDVAIWGTSPRKTAEAVACFVERYLPEYLAAVRLERRD